ncbi:thioredoxin-dependent thiol peroxidase [Candidatus Uhrbacteria bacterium CG10_big_fil_rev_8_21_14_0_10_50_16]|uniref:thioredoxin-dependent peroxiredoxin n=1 Tax=Candidatus Uhrbacteria bacterium CG10_big_fil_rev_8_21_14_0_10_50_16 TaxID=1975039 RepID=A0A2H0RM21_9BACT|nr:MAG: thioredoxin-dependent thiol peroxidase [Candidatus Uhrbacteria bacterium CG10_big_fil_rev_8_21_14_0_10_50_16]
MKAKDFSLVDQNGVVRTLNDYKGQYVLLYFYPKDMTPGCTIEAVCFRDSLNDFKAVGIQVLGVSADTVASHKKFADAHKLNFPLLSDVDRTVIRSYGAEGEKSMFGKKYMGILRDSFLIDPKGVIAKHYEKVNPAKHAQEVLDDMRQQK